MKAILGLALFLFMSSFCFAQSAKPTETSNPEMKRIFDEDQGARKQPNIDWAVVAPADAARREATRKLIAAEQLNTGEDFERAAFVFQHGDKPDDYLLAHTLAMIAVAKGQKSALWIASATLDRYLQSSGKPQIYGTQYLLTSDKPATQDPYDRKLISDAVRKELGVRSQAEQEVQLKKFDAKRQGNDSFK